MTDVKSLEYSSLIIPYEVLNKTFRNAQKVIDREVSHINTSSEELKKLSLHGANVSTEDTILELDGLIHKLQLLKEKSTAVIVQEENRLSICRTRLDHVSGNQQSDTVYKRNRLNRMLVDYFLRSGLYNTAIEMVEKSGLQEFVDLNVFLVAQDVENTLKAKNTTLCLQWCHSNRSKLKKMHSTLELNVRIQEFMELVKKEQRTDAVIYARKHFRAFTDGVNLFQILKTVLAVLAFKPNTNVKRYKELFAETRWDLLVELFRRDNLSLHQLDTQSIMEIALQCGLASLKTPHCFHNDEKCQDCPVCHRLFNDLAKPLPFSHSSQSRLLCRISGERMNEHNHPLMLPNGNVYGESSLQDMAINGEIVCAKSGKVYSMDDAKKIYIM